MIQIGSIQIDPGTRTLYRDGGVIPVGSRAFDILVAVVSANGRLVSKNELMAAVWPKTIVEDNNIQVHLSSLRKILGPDRHLIATVPGRGYQMVRKTKPSPQDSCGCGLPRNKSTLVGYEHATAQICRLLETCAVLTLVGAGGIGKSSLAIEAAHRASAGADLPVCFVDLAALRTKSSVLAAIGATCGLAIANRANDGGAIATNSRRRRRLLVLNNAERVIDHVAEIVELLSASNEALHILVTSREPLRIASETVYGVKALTVPALHANDAQILQCSAVRLFKLRVDSMQGTESTQDVEPRIAGEICRRLGGNPLAIELAATRVAMLGINELADRLDDRMALLTGGYRTALPHHQSLRATFDWSFSTLGECSQSLFRNLAVFENPFTFETLCAAVCDGDYGVEDAVRGIADLVAKSLVSVVFEGPVARFHLCETTRAYAMQKWRPASISRGQPVARSVQHCSAR